MLPAEHRFRVAYLRIDAGMRRRIAMKIKDVLEIVKKKGVDIKVGRKKEDMIREYQMIEGYSPCFHTKDSCAEDCMWKEDCLNV
jgi:hypothetical protein